MRGSPTMPDTSGLIPPKALAHIRKYDDEWDGRTVALLLAHIDAMTEAVRALPYGDWSDETRTVEPDLWIRRAAVLAILGEPE